MAFRPLRFRSVARSRPGRADDGPHLDGEFQSLAVLHRLPALLVACHGCAAAPASLFADRVALPVPHRGRRNRQPDRRRQPGFPRVSPLRLLCRRDRPRGPHGLAGSDDQRRSDLGYGQFRLRLRRRGAAGPSAFPTPLAPARAPARMAVRHMANHRARPGRAPAGDAHPPIRTSAIDAWSCPVTPAAWDWAPQRPAAIGRIRPTRLAQDDPIMPCPARLPPFGAGSGHARPPRQALTAGMAIKAPRAGRCLPRGTAHRNDAEACPDRGRRLGLPSARNESRHRACARPSRYAQRLPAAIPAGPASSRDNDADGAAGDLRSRR